ncbi:MAG: DNA mismatch repair endonuclease MutH [Gammaproteobacteria bacterium]
MKQYKYTQPPTTEQELLARIETLAGKTLSQVALMVNVDVPENQNTNKGWTGQLAELVLGATASNRSEPDFQHLGIELKTIPMSKPGIPKESTYISTVNLTKTTSIKWDTSTVRKKLARVLWLPVESDKTIPLKHRRFGNALLWSPNTRQEKIIRNDWEEIMELICSGDLDKISSSLGTYLQIRPKAANARSLGNSYSNEGVKSSTLPRGFYLRSSFTRTLFNNESD